MTSWAAGPSQVLQADLEARKQRPDVKVSTAGFWGNFMSRTGDAPGSGAYALWLHTLTEVYASNHAL